MSGLCTNTLLALHGGREVGRSGAEIIGRFGASQYRRSHPDNRQHRSRHYAFVPTVASEGKLEEEWGTP